MSRALDDLVEPFRTKAMVFLARSVEAGIPLLLVETRRTPAQHALNLAKGASWTPHSKHLDGLAMDVVPYELYTAAPGGDKLAWNIDHPSWVPLVKIAKGLGFRCGADWAQRDYCHFEDADSGGDVRRSMKTA